MSIAPASDPVTKPAGPLRVDWGPRSLSVLRIVASLLFLEHGLQKLFGFPADATAHSPMLFSLIWTAGAIELAGGAMLLIGLLTRPVAFILSGEMAFAYWMVHAPRSLYPALNGGDSAILFCFLFLYMAVVGGGAWSMDHMRIDH